MVWTVKSYVTTRGGRTSNKVTHKVTHSRRHTRAARPARRRLRALPTPTRIQQVAPAEMPATGPARLLAHPGLIAHITSLGDSHRASVLEIPRTLDRIREKARITDPGSAAARALDAACLLGYLAAMSDTILALYFRRKEGDLPADPKALEKLEAFLNGLSLPILLGTLDAATKAGKPPLEVLFKSFTRHWRPDKGKH
jgi:hypothetical protein